MLLHRKHVYHGKIIHLDIDQVRLPNGHTLDLEVIHHPGGAAVVAVDDRHQVCMLRQYRHVVGDWVWEIPAGKLDAEEAPLRTAKRELQEEAGFRAGEWQDLGSMISSPGVFSEVVHLYLASDLSLGETDQEPEEVIDVGAQVAGQILSFGKDADGKTVDYGSHVREGTVLARIDDWLDGSASGRQSSP